MQFTMSQTSQRYTTRSFIGRKDNLFTLKIYFYIKMYSYILFLYLFNGIILYFY